MVSVRSRFNEPSTARLMFRCDDDLIANRLERFADELLVGERAINLRCVEQRHAALNGRPDDGDHRVLVGVASVRAAHAHTTKTER